MWFVPTSVVDNNYAFWILYLALTQVKGALSKSILMAMPVNSASQMSPRLLLA